MEAYLEVYPNKVRGVEGQFCRVFPFGGTDLSMLKAVQRSQATSRVPSGLVQSHSSATRRSFRWPQVIWLDRSRLVSDLSPVQKAVNMTAETKLRYADIGINLSDPIFRGVYHGKQRHDDDLEDVVQRALDVGCSKLMVTGSNLRESKRAIDLAKQYSGICYATVGIHPCSTQDFEKHKGGPDRLLQELKTLATQAKNDGYAVAFGEIGLDWDRLFLSPKETQLKYFRAQLELAIELQLPLFLHSRSCQEDFENLVKPLLEQLPKRGLVHSFTGTIEEMQSLIDMGFDIGINGCSMKTEENLAAVKQVPLERIQIETDGPWCEIRPSHASAQYLKDGGPAVPKGVKKEKFEKGLMVKGRNEPVMIVQVAHVIAKVKGISVEEVCEAAWQNSTRMFGLGVTT